MENILKRANEIVNERSEEKERMYGPFSDCMKNATAIFNQICPAKLGYLTPEGFYYAMIAMKFAREIYSHKKDNLLDAVAYIGALDNFLDGKK